LFLSFSLTHILTQETFPTLPRPFRRSTAACNGVSPLPSRMRSRPVTRGFAPLEKFSPPLEICVGYSLKLLDIVQKIWATQKTVRPSWCPKLVTGLMRSANFLLVCSSLKCSVFCGYITIVIIGVLIASELHFSATDYSASVTNASHCCFV